MEMVNWESQLLLSLDTTQQICYYDSIFLLNEIDEKKRDILSSAIQVRVIYNKREVLAGCLITFFFSLMIVYTDSPTAQVIFVFRLTVFFPCFYLRLFFVFYSIVPTLNALQCDVVTTTWCVYTKNLNNLKL